SWRAYRLAQQDAEGKGKPAMADGQRATIDPVVGDSQHARDPVAVASIRRRLRVLFLVTAHNSLSQRARVALVDVGHVVTVAVVDSAPAMEAAAARHRPDLIVCPILKTIIPESVWSRHRCLVVHPGPKGDRGPSSLDWALELGMAEWGVTVLEA